MSLVGPGSRFDNIGLVDADNYPALGFDPAPGALSSVATLAESFSQVATKLDAAHGALTGIGRSGGIWQGEAAEGFRGTVGELPGYLDKARTSLGGASTVLQQWSDDLSSLKQTAAQYEQAAARATQQVEQARSNPDLNLGGQFFTDSASLQQAQARLDAAVSELSAAQDELDTIRRQAQRLLDQHADLAAAVAGALAQAKEHAPEEPGFFDRIGDLLSGIGKAVEDLAADVWQWVKDNAETIKKIGDVLSAIGTMLSIAAVVLAPVPVVGQVVLAAAIGMNGAALATHGLAKAAGADVGWSTLAFDGLGMIPGGGVAKGGLGLAKAAPTVGRAVAQGVRGAADVGEAIVRGGKAAGEALEGLSRTQFKDWVKTYNTIAGKVGVEAVAVGSSAAHVAGAAVGTVQKVGIAAGMWVADPYIDRATEVGKGYYDALSNGTRPPSAAETFNRIVHGRAAE